MGFKCNRLISSIRQTDPRIDRIKEDRRLGGLVIDILIAFVIKSALRLRRAWGSGKWQRVKARVDSSCLAGGWVWNCPTTEIAYTYEIAGQTYSVIDSNPFLSESSAKVEVERFRPGKYAVVRVNPMQPQRSVIKWADQPN